MSHYDVIIIGAGAAGLMCAIEAGKRGRRVLVLDKAKKAGRKILISGGGRCNFTNLNIEASAYQSENPHFCKSALAQYSQWDFIALVEQHQLSWHEKTLGQLFCDQRAPAILEMLMNECNKAKVEVVLNCEIKEVKDTPTFSVITQLITYSSTSLVIATGGPSIPGMGATDFGLQLAQQMNIKTVPFLPGLVPFTFSSTDIAHFFKDLSGISLSVEISNKNTFFKEQILITHRGISGPACLQISSYWQAGDTIDINLLPELNASQWLLEQQQQRGKAALKTVLSEHFPKRLAYRLANTLSNKALGGTPMGEINQANLKAFGQTLNQWSLRPAGTEGMRTAEVSLGGVDTHALSSKTLETRAISKLYFIGETVDVTGWLGGYNFQWAWSSGWAAGQSV